MYIVVRSVIHNACQFIAANLSKGADSGNVEKGNVNKDEQPKSEDDVQDTPKHIHTEVPQHEKMRQGVEGCASMKYQLQYTVVSLCICVCVLNCLINT